MLDELHDLFAPRIEEVYKNPSPILEALLRQLDDVSVQVERTIEQYPSLEPTFEHGLQKAQTLGTSIDICRMMANLHVTLME